MALDYTQPIDIDIESERINVNEIPENIRSTHRFLLKFISIAEYSIDVDCTIFLYYKQLNDETEFTLNYTLSKDETRFKCKLPLGINCREWRIRIIGTGLTEAEFAACEVLWLPRRIGDR